MNTGSNIRNSPFRLSMGFISGSLVGVSDMGPFSCYRESAAGTLPAIGGEHVRERGFEGLAIETAADDLFPADDEAAGVVLILVLALQVGFELDPDGLGLGLQLLHLGFDALELGDAVVQLTVCHVGTLLFVLVWGRGRESVSHPAYSGNAFPRPGVGWCSLLTMI